MSRKKLVITGASGFLGSRAAQYYESRYEVLAPSHRELDLCQDAAVQRYLEKERPDYVFHCAAVSDTGRCQQEPEETQRLNVTAVGFLAKACNLVGAKLIFCSSDQIYFGAPGIEAHREEDAVSPVNVYGQQKLEKVFLDNFGENDWYGGFEDYVKECSVYLEKASVGKPVRASLFYPLLIVIALSLLAAAAVVAVIWQKMETVSKKATANDYVSAGLRLTEQTDRFTHKTTSSRKIERSSSSSGSSHSESGGGGSGRSGKF